MGKNLIKNKNSVNLGGRFTFTCSSPKNGENINFAMLETVLRHKNEKNKS